MTAALKAKSLIAVLVVVITFVVFLPVLSNEFLNWDDGEYIYENPFIRAMDAKLFKASFLEFHVANWHPLAWISHALDYSIWGLNPLGHHLTNSVLHALNSLLVVLLVIRLMEVLRKRATSSSLSGSFLDDRTVLVTGAVAGILFGIHPLHVESVAWVSERKDLLCAMFFLLSIMTYTKYAISICSETAQKNSVLRWRNKHYLFTMGVFVLALLSKPMAVTLPLVLLILDWYPFRRIQSLKTLGTAFAEKLPFLALSLISSIVTILAQRAGGAMAPTELVPLSTRVIVAAKALVTYLWKMIVPLNLVPFYSYPKNISFFSLEYLFPIVLVIGITTICVVLVKKEKLWLSVWGYYLITLLPVLGIVQVGSQPMADRYTYLPSLGPFLVIGLFTAAIYERIAMVRRGRTLLNIAGGVVAIAVLISLSYLTNQQILLWKNSLVFWNYIIEKEPGRVPVAHTNLGIALSDKGRTDEAIEQYQIALRLNPDFEKAHNNLGNAYKSKGLLDMAIEQYQRALELKPDYAEAHNNLGNAYKSKGLLDMAIGQYQRALELKPDYAEAYNNLGVAYKSKGLLDMAIEQYQRALELKPDFAEAHNNVGNVYKAKGLTDKAVEQYLMALRLKPDYAEAHFNLGLAYLGKGSADLARREFVLGLRIKPDDDRARQLLNGIISKEGY